MATEPGFYNMDCMEGMKEFPDGFFDLAIVDPVYGDVTKGGYMTHNKGQRIGTGAANSKGYHAGLWGQQKSGADYFQELRRVSQNQIIWGGITSQICCLLLRGISCGTSNIKPNGLSPIAKLRGLRFAGQREYSASCGMGCSRAT